MGSNAIGQSQVITKLGNPTSDLTSDLTSDPISDPTSDPISDPTSDWCFDQLE